MLMCGRQLKGLWVLSEPNMIDFGHVGTFWCVAGSWRYSGVLSDPTSGMTDLWGILQAKYD
jgi:hypothetical protein